MTSPYAGFTLEADEIVSLPLDELAMHVLNDYVIMKEWNWRNWLLQAHQAYQNSRAAQQALSEAWNWIVTHGLVVQTIEQSSPEAVQLSRRGEQVLKAGLPWLRATERLDIDLLPALERTARPQFLRGDFQTAAFVAMKEVEVAVRSRANLSDSLVGVKLMRQAFGDGGPLFAGDGDKGEAVALMELFAGSIGSFKNPSSHRRVDFSDPTEAAEIVLLADLLLRLLSKVPTKDNGDA